MTANELPTPFYIVYEDRLRANLRIINDVAERSGAKSSSLSKPTRYGAHSRLSPNTAATARQVRLTNCVSAPNASGVKSIHIPLPIPMRI